jgi:aminoglycoside 6'-N-acetyltransferase I
MEYSIHALTKREMSFIDDVASLLLTAFPQSYSPMSIAVEEVYDCLLDDRIALVAVGNTHAIGFIGARPQYGTTGWELHPLVVSETCRGQGIGASLVHALEDVIASRGGVTIYLGSDDEFGTTSLSGCDLYDNLWDRIREVRNLGGHPYSFYEKVGYAIVGVIPDANGVGKPDIWMAKRIAPNR